mmetsp:Transcript_63357/g.137909  ORF Transcript_63357/g.137909 Transcript_63357/m.137909 type:complete len:537 (+) Transcript_63357:45-1655(+)
MISVLLGLLLFSATSRAEAARVRGAASIGHAGNVSEGSSADVAFHNPVTDIAERIREGAQKVSDVAKKVEEIANKTGEVVAKVQAVEDARKPTELGGHTRGAINLFIVFVLAFVSFASLLGHGMERCFSKGTPEDGRMKGWLVGLQLASYVVLVYGIFAVLVSFNLSITAFGFHVNVTRSPDGTPTALTESILSLIKAMLDNGAELGAVLVIFYAMFVPAVKFLLLIVSALWRNSTDPWRVQAARRCIVFVQFISKWACPDMFAYILLLHLFSHLDNGALIEAPSKLDVGFTCFCVFCICSTFSSLAIELPKVPEESVVTPSPWVLRHFGKGGVQCLASLWGVVFAIAFLVGIFWPCMGIRLDKHLLFEPVGNIPATYAPILDILNIDEQVNSDVSLVLCSGTLLQRVISDGEANCLLALVILFGFAICLPVIDMAALLVAAFKLRSKPVEASESKSTLDRAMALSHVLKHVSMLDVCIMGVVAICMSGRIYREQGVNIMILPGLTVLIVAEAVHYAMYDLVSSAVDFSLAREHEK